MNQPTQYTAKELKTGQTVTGWYVQLHASEFDPSTGEGVGRYTLRHCLFNDMPAASPTGGYWAEIDPETLRPVAQQLTIFAGGECIAKAMERMSKRK